jgi:hypothetical protein
MHPDRRRLAGDKGGVGCGGGGVTRTVERRGGGRGVMAGQGEQRTYSEDEQAGGHSSGTDWQTQIGTPKNVDKTRGAVHGRGAPEPDHGSTALTPGGGSRLQGQQAEVGDRGGGVTATGAP